MSTAIMDLPEHEYVMPGTRTCAGCGLPVAYRHILKALGPKTIVTLPACCLTILHGIYPKTPIAVNAVKPRKEVRVEFEAEDEKALLYDWLERFLYLHDAQGLVMSKFKVEDLSRSKGGLRIKARAWGERFDPAKHARQDIEVTA